MVLSIRPLTAGDYPGVVAILNAIRHMPTTVAEKADWVRTFRAEYPITHLVAQVDGAIAGYAVAYNASWIMPNRIHAEVLVDPARRRQGIGSALADALAPFLTANRREWLTTSIFDDDASSLAWAERRGFAKQHHFFYSVLRLAEFDASPFAGHVDRVLARGFRFITFDAIQSPETEAELHRFFHMLLAQTPSGADSPLADFADWRRWLLGEGAGWPAGILLALDAQGQWAGLTALRRESPETAYIALTGGAGAHRNQGLALALKLRAMEIMWAAGVEEVTTANHSANGPMLAVNRKLGYVPLPGHFLLRKRIG